MISDVTIVAIPGEVMIPNPPCPASHTKRGSRGSGPTTGQPSGANVRSPAHARRTDRIVRVVAFWMRSMPSATSSSSCATS